MIVFRMLEVSAWGNKHFRCRVLKKKRCRGQNGQKKTREDLLGNMPSDGHGPKLHTFWL